MTETQEEKLLPCPFCGGIAIGKTGEDSRGRETYYVECCECYVKGRQFYTISEVIDAWNRRATEAVAQWTSETPSEDGWYCVYYASTKTIKRAFVYEQGAKIVIGNDIYFGGVNDLPPKSNNILWYKLPEPPIPAEREEKK
jgi:Lar family restriction alleviation protein